LFYKLSESNEKETKRRWICSWWKWKRNQEVMWMLYSQEKNKKLKESDPRLDYLASLPKLTNLLDNESFA